MCRKNVKPKQSLYIFLPDHFQNNSAWKQNEIEIALTVNQYNDCFYVPVNFANLETLQVKLSLPIAVSLQAKKEKKI